MQAYIKCCSIRYKVMTSANIWFVVCLPGLGGFPPAPVVKIKYENVSIISELTSD